MAIKTEPKSVKKTSTKKTANRHVVPKNNCKLRKLITDLEDVGAPSANPCQAALERVKKVLTAADIAKLKPELDLLKKAVAGCPADCGCSGGSKRVIISAHGKILGELSCVDGRFSSLCLNGAGEDLLGEDISKLRYVGLAGVPGFASPVQVRDPDFLAAFVAWCGERGCETLVLTEFQLPLWSKLQASLPDEEYLLPLMRKLQALPQDDALRIIEDLGNLTGEEICF
jgi:hypothetical protein